MIDAFNSPQVNLLISVRCLSSMILTIKDSIERVSIEYHFLKTLHIWYYHHENGVFNESNYKL
jgi:hypothetical protein